MQIPSLRRQLEAFIEGEFSSDDYEVKDTSLVDMIVEAKDAAFPDPVMEILHKKLAKVELERVKEVCSWILSSLLKLKNSGRLLLAFFRLLKGRTNRPWVDRINLDSLIALSGLYK